MTQRILKGDDVQLQGSVQLSGATIQSNPTANSAAQTTGPQVNLINNTAEFAILEVTCGCGRKTQIKCQFPTQ